MGTKFSNEDFDLAEGTLRTVLMFPSFVVKFPLTWRGFKSNRYERRWWKLLRDSRLCPISWSDPFGFLVVMRRADFIEDEDIFWNLDLDEHFEGLPLDLAPENCGYLGNKLVLIDYGALSFPPF